MLENEPQKPNNSAGNKITAFVVIFLVAFAGFMAYGIYTDKTEAQAKHEYKTAVQSNGLTKAETEKYENTAEQMLLKSVNDPSSIKILDMDAQAVGKDIVCVSGEVSGKNSFNATIKNHYELFIRKSNNQMLLFKIGDTFLYGSEKTYDEMQAELSAAK